MGKRGRPKQFDAPDLRVRIDKVLEAKLDSLPGESRSQKVRDLIDEAALEHFVNEDAKKRRDAAWQHAIENR